MAEPVYFLAAAPTEPMAVPTLTREHGVREFLEHPPHARWDGWNLLTLERAELRSGPRLHIQNGDRKIIDLHADGTLTAIGKFDGFLGWGRWVFRESPKVNGLAVVEFTHEFVSFYERLLHEFIKPLPDRVRFAVGARAAIYELDGTERRLYLTPGPVSERTLDDQYSRREAREPSFTNTFDVDTAPSEPHLDVPTVTYGLVKRFYNWFGLTDDAVPYANQARNAIDLTLITNRQ
jgi:hypothetical protein